jgi:hypothetical protein
MVEVEGAPVDVSARVGVGEGVSVIDEGSPVGVDGSPVMVRVGVGEDVSGAPVEVTAADEVATGLSVTSTVSVDVASAGADSVDGEVVVSDGSGGGGVDSSGPVGDGPAVDGADGVPSAGSPSSGRDAVPSGTLGAVPSGALAVPGRSSARWEAEAGSESSPAASTSHASAPARAKRRR